MSQSGHVRIGKSAKFQVHEIPSPRDGESLVGKSEGKAVRIPNLLGLQAGIALSFMAIAGESSAQTYDPAIELAIRQAIPKPARCGTTTEPLFYCRFDTVSEANVALELLATKDGPSASLTYNYGDPRSTELLAVVRDFFGSVGIDMKSLDRCFWRSHTMSDAMDIGDMKLRCRHTDFSDRVTYEVFVDRARQVPPGTSGLAAGLL